MAGGLPDGKWLRLEEAVAYWQETYLPTLADPAVRHEPNPRVEGYIIIQADPAIAAAMREFDEELSDAAFKERVKLTGKRDENAHDNGPIPIDFFRSPRGFWRNDGTIDPLPCPISDGDLYRAAVTGESAWRDVLVERTGYGTWLAAEYPRAGKRRAATAGTETAATKALAAHLKGNPDLKLAEAKEWCRRSGYELGKRAFERVWAQARLAAGLSRVGSPGRKRKSSH